MRLTITCFFLLAMGSCAQAQDFNNYTPLESQNPIPDVVLNPEIPSLSDKDTNPFAEDTSAEFSLQVSQDNYALLAELKASGKILFNDPVSIYMTKVADKALAKQPALRRQLTFFVIKSPSVNSFTSLKGEVYITLGLIGQLETEAELAYIICREAANFELKHAWENYEEGLRLGANQNEFVKPTLEERLFSRCMYKADQAASADLYGFEIYKETGYHMFAPNYVFDYLLYAAYPFDDMYFTHTLLETDHLQFPKAYLLDKTRPLIPEELFDPVRAVHPSIQQRRNDVNQEAGPIFDQGKIWFKLSENEFEIARKLARYEMCRQYLLQRRYVEALYTAYMLQFYDPHNLYLKKVQVKSLYGLALYANRNKKYMVVPDWQQTDGYWQQLHHLLTKLTPGELNGLALVTAWNARKSFPNDSELEAITRELFRELTGNHFLSLSELYDEPAIAESGNTGATSSGTPVGGTNLRSNKTGKDSFIRYAFVDIKKEPQFVEMFEYYRKSSSWVEVRLNEESGYTEPGSKKPKTPAQSAPANLLNIEKIVLNQPDYQVMDRTNPNADIRLSTDLQGQATLGRIFENVAAKAGIEAVVLTPELFSKEMVAQYNDLSFLNEWIDERGLHKDVELLSVDQSHAELLQRKYATRYFGHVNVVRTIAKRQNKGAVLAATVIALPALPFGVYYASSADYTTSFNTRLYDIETGRLVYDNYNLRKMKDNENNLEKAVIRELESIRKLEQKP
ncbi:MAG: hypothetical protein KF690_07430 [Bacteroidetes bacterium]|nr:hypothetical protein [Bacteroidota bacterium]